MRGPTELQLVGAGVFSGSLVGPVSTAFAAPWKSIVVGNSKEQSGWLQRHTPPHGEKVRAPEWLVIVDEL